jgi:tetratricopeptide (TPR) repeat protein
LGLAYEALGRYQEAVDAYKQAIRFKPDDADTHRNLGECYFRLGSSVADLSSPVRSAASMKFLLLAADSFNEVVKLRPNDANAYEKLGSVYNSMKLYSVAIEAYQQAIRLKPDWAAAHDGLGIVYLNSGRYNEAVDAFKQAIRLEPDWSTPHYMLGIVYVELGDRVRALDEYKILKELDPEAVETLFDHIYP